MSSDREGGDIFEIPYLLCTKCGHDLNHPLYTILQHPVLPVPLCVLCSEEIQEKFEQRLVEEQESDKTGEGNSNYEDLCSWCYNDADSALFLCDNPDGCSLQFCSRCIEDNLGSQVLADIEKRDRWICFACAPEQLNCFHDALLIGKENSRLEELKNLDFQNSSSANTEENGENDEKVEKIAVALTDIVNEVQNSIQKLDENIINQQENEIRKELIRLYPNESISNLSKNEIDLYCTYWRRHIDILQREESILFELMETFGYDPRDLQVYKLDIEKLEKEQSFNEKQAMISAEIQLRELEKQILENSATHLCQAGFDYQEAIEEEDNPDFEKISIEAETSPIVQKYADSEDVAADLYPSSFDRVLPKSILKALFHGSWSECKELTTTFNIPPHIPLIMTLAQHELPSSTENWSFASYVHPSVRKALYHARSPVESAILCQRYNLDPEICGVTDFGNTKDIYNLFMKEKEKKKQRVVKITEKDVNEAVETEDNKCSDEAKEFISHTRAQIKSNPPSRTKVQTDLKSFFMISAKVEDEDEMKIQKEKKNAMDVALKNQTKRKKRSSPSPKGFDPPLAKFQSLEEKEKSRIKEESILPKKSEGVRKLEKPSVVIVMDIDDDGEIDSKEGVSSTPITNTKMDTSKQSLSSGSGSSKKTSPSVQDLSASDDLYWPNQSPLVRKAPSNIVDLSLDDSDIEFLDDEGDDIKNRKSLIDNLQFDSDSDDGKKSKNRTTPSKSSSSTAPARLLKGRGRLSIDPKQRTLHIQNYFSKETLQAKRVEKERRLKLLAFDYFADDDKAIAINNLRPEGEPAINVSSNFIKQLKPHQIDGLRFIWKNVMGSITDASKISKAYYGCVLAHCMGLGKTFTIISFVVTMLTNPIIRGIEDPKDKKAKLKAVAESNSGELQVNTESQSSDVKDSLVKGGESSDRPKDQAITSPNGKGGNGSALIQLPPDVEIKRLIYRVMIVVPKNTLQNWVDEFKKWTPEDLLEQFNLILIDSTQKKDHKTIRRKRIQQWFADGGVLIIGYELLRLMAGDDPSPHYTEEEKAEFQRLLLKPGPDLVIADEAHTIKNAKSKLRLVLEKVETTRRIALTGSPLQNNLEEYWVMVNWVKRHFLYSLDEYRRIFVLPIKHGSNKEATLAQIMQMKKRTHALYHKLTPVVHRRDNSELSNALLPKREFILSIKMTEFQKFLYKYYLAKLPNTGRTLFKAYQCLMRIWNHPCTAIYHYHEQLQKNLLAERKLSALGTKNEEKEEVVRKAGRPVGSKNEPRESSTTSSSNKLTVDDFREQLKESYAYYLYCSSSTNKMMEIESAADALEERMYVGKEQQDINLLREADAQLKEADMEIDFQEPVTRSESSSDEDKSEAEDEFEFEDEKMDEEPKKRMKSLSKGKEKKKSQSEDQFDGYFEEDDYELDSFVVEGEDDSDFESYASWSESSSSSNDSDEETDEDSDAIDLISDEEEVKKKRPEKRKRSEKPTKIDKLSKAKKQKKSHPEKRDKQSANPKNSKKSKPNTKSPGEAEVIVSNTQSKTTEKAVDRSLSVSVDSSEASEGKLLSAQPSSDKLDDLTAKVPAKTPIDPSSSNIAEDTLVEEEPVDVLSPDWWKFKSELAELSNNASLMKEVQLSNRQLVEISNKMMVFLNLLVISMKHNDKMLVFSQSLYTLNVIESFLGMKLWGRVCGIMKDDESINVNGCLLSQWKLNDQYLRIDGSISNRQKIIHEFNTKNRYRLMLISTKAGNMGINLQSANRVVIFDSSWNPVHDLQAIFRTYRFGQEKNVFVYRLYAAGSMEEKIHKNQVVKQSLSERVVDKKMPENHFTDSERAEFLAFVDEEEKKTEGEGEPAADKGESNSGEDAEKDQSSVTSATKIVSTIDFNPEEIRTQKLLSVIASGTKDEVLFELVERMGTKIFKSVEDHDSLLADKLEEHLNEEEQRQAIDELEREAEVHRRVTEAANQRITGQTPALPSSSNAIRSNSSSNGLAYSIGGQLILEQPSNSAQLSAKETSLQGLIVDLLVPNPEPVIPQFLPISNIALGPPTPIPTNIPMWKPEYDTMLIILALAFPTEKALVTITKLVNAYIARSDGKRQYEQSLYKQRLQDIKTSSRGYYQYYTTSPYIRHRVAVVLERMKRLQSTLA